MPLAVNFDKKIYNGIARFLCHSTAFLQAQAQIIAIEVLGGVANLLGKRRPQGVGVYMYTVQKSMLASSYTIGPPPLTFPLSLRVSEILPLLCSSTPLFPFHLQSLPNFPMFPWNQVDDLWARKSEDVGLIVREIIFHDFQPMCGPNRPPTSQTDGRRDRRHAITIPRFALKCIAL